MVHFLKINHMKKLLLALTAILCMATVSFSQAKKSDKTKPATAAGKPAPAAKPAPGLKKDGTPDMRLKANKDAAAAKPAGPLKKDGTPDMRYKANKTAAKKKA
jgi:hypothetical protein